MGVKILKVSLVGGDEPRVEKSEEQQLVEQDEKIAKAAGLRFPDEFYRKHPDRYLAVRKAHTVHIGPQVVQTQK